MRVFLFYFLILTSVFSFGQKNRNTIGFTENKGQIINQKGKANTAVLYLLNTPGLNVQLKKNSFSYDIYETKKIPPTEKDKAFLAPQNRFGAQEETPNHPLTYSYHRIDIDFLNANANVQLVAEEKSKDYDNYYNVSHAPEGITNVHKYQKVTYKNLYNNIDAVFFIPNDSTKVVEYNFIIRPGGKISDIQLKFNGAKTELTDNKIKMKVRFGEMEETLPLSWIEQGNSRKEIAVGYKKIKKNVYGFEGDVNASDKTIVIDPVPVRLWGTYYGGGGGDVAGKITTDNMNNIYISGNTQSHTNIATAGTHMPNFTTTNPGFVVKFSFEGVRFWGTYYEIPLNEIAIDNNQNIYCTVTVFSTPYNITTSNSYQPIKNNFNDAYLVKFNSQGIREWATYYGGERNDYANGVACDYLNNVYIYGEADSITSLSSPNAHQENIGSTNGYTDGFIAKFSGNGARLWGTYYGGSYADAIFDVFPFGDFIYLVGGSRSNNNISTTGAFQENLNGYADATVLKFDLNGNRIWGTYVGSDGVDQIRNSHFKNNMLYLSGDTSSTSGIATPNTFMTNYFSVNWMNDYAMFVIKFNGIDQQIEWGTYFNAVIQDINTNSLDDIYLSGFTDNDSGISTPGAYRPTKLGNQKPYLVKLNNEGQKIWGTYVGGDGYDYQAKSTIDATDAIYVYGITTSNTGISTPYSHQITYATGGDTFITKFMDCQSSTVTTSDSYLCYGQNIELIANGGINYSWTGPNGFSSNQQNPIINNANASHNGLYTCTITGIEGCENTTLINVVVGDTTAPTPTITNLPTINGDCNTTITTIPTATDNCSGTITATTISPLNYSLPGTYTIVWNYNDGNGNIATQNQTVIISATTLPTLSSSQQFCFQQNATLNNITITGQNIKWYDAPTGGNLLANTTLLQNGTTYYASQTINNCESSRVPVTVTIQNTPVPIGNSAQSFCSSQNATLNDIAISGTNIIWYSSLTGTTVLPAATLLADNATYYATQTINNCESPTRLAITVTLINTLNANNYAETLCDDLNNGTENINLSDYNTDLIATTSGSTFTYYHSQNGAENQINSEAITNFTNHNLTTGSHVIYVRIDSNNGCHQIVELNLTLVNKPNIPITDIMPICEGSSITVSAGTGFDSYLWSTAETSSSITIATPGNYSVTVTENHGGISCASVKNFTVVNSNAATIAEIITTDWTSNQNTISVLIAPNSNGNYLYSLDGVNYQASNTFTNLPHGEYTVFVKDDNGCGIQTEEVYLLMYPNFFTPNGDGFNDYWKIELSEYEPNMNILIFDRYGKLLKELGADSQGWNGTYSGSPVPSNDYWFVVKRQNGKEYRGHFSLKR